MKGYVLDFKTIKNTSEIAGISDQVLRNIEKDEMVLVMFNQKDKGISIGYDDTKAPFFKEGVQHYRHKGYAVNIRGAGGRSVASDEGILNFSILMKTDMASHDLYMFFYNFIQDAFAPLKLQFDIGEVKGAYCPGTYDISINGKKVAGTASRKIQGNALIGCYLGVNGNQEERSQTISEFYEITQDVIRVSPDKLTTLSQELGQEISIDTARSLLLEAFKKYNNFVGDYDTSSINKDALEQSKKRSVEFMKRYIQD